MTWRYTDSTELVVVRDTESGGMESKLVSTEEVQAWIGNGNVPDPFVAPPPDAVAIGYATMRARMTDAERQAILEACRTNWQLDDFVRLAQAEGQIVLGSDVTAAAKATLIAAGLLTPPRAEEIFAAP